MEMMPQAIQPGAISKKPQRRGEHVENAGPQHGADAPRKMARLPGAGSLVFFHQVEYQRNDQQQAPGCAPGMTAPTATIKCIT
jgi:hypothetical protein